MPNASNAHRVLQILEEAQADEPAPPDVSPGLVLPRGPGARVRPRDRRRAVPGGGRPAFMQCAESEFRRRPVIVTRSGYTGEVGFELFTYQDIALELWRDPARGDGPVRAACPCGLAARDVLRLEMGYPLYGQDLFESSTALEAGLSWAVAFDKGQFRGREALLAPAGRRVAQPPAGPADAGTPAHPAGALPGLHRRSRDRGGDERHVLAPAPDGDRARVPVAGATPPRSVTRSRSTSAVAAGTATVVRPPFVDRSPR